MSRQWLLIRFQRGKLIIKDEAEVLEVCVGVSELKKRFLLVVDEAFFHDKLLLKRWVRES